MRRFSSSVIALALSLLAPAGASAQLFQPGTQPVGTDGGLVDPIQPSRPCQMCHGGYDDTDDYEPYDSWRGSMMGSAARDPVARAAMAIAEADQPGPHDATDFCLRCHSPTAWLNGRSSLPEYDATNPVYPQRLFPDESPVLSLDLDGVGCMVCHRAIRPSDPALITNAELVLLDGADALVRVGPYDYAPGTAPSHPTRQDEFDSSSDLCGSCHDITNPLAAGHRGVDATGRPFALERTYSEWRNSAFYDRARGCQDCHLPEVNEAGANMGSPVRPHMSRHDLAGGSVWVALAIADAARDADPTAADFLTASSARAQAMLQNAATLEIRASALDVASSTATATVRVTNISGHKLPTGYTEGRRMWLDVEVVDSTGRVVAGSGTYDDATATLSSDAQLRTYEATMGQGTTPSFHFFLVDTLIEDTRIPPEGFRAPDTADAAPLGRDYSDGAGGYRNWDEASYSFDSLCGTGTLTLRARLRYQSTTREYIEFLRDNAPPSTDPALSGSSWGQVAYTAWHTFGGDRPVDMEEATVDLGAVTRACPAIDAGPVDAFIADAGPAADSGASVDAGMAVDAGVGADAGDHPTSGGCGCHAGARSLPSSAAAWLVVLALAVLGRARRRR